MLTRTISRWLLISLLASGRLWAGGSGLNVIVVVNQNSTNSLQLGNDYCELRGVPPQNVLRLNGWTGGSINWSPADFTAKLLNPLQDMIARRGLARQSLFVLLSMDIPYRVTDGTGQNSTTSALFYGFKTNGAPVVGIASCSLPDNSSNSYAFSELPFSQAPPNTANTNSFLAMMLTDTNLAGAENILRRSVVADCTYPTQTVYLAKTSDSARNVRFQAFDNAIFENQVVGNNAVQRMNGNATTFTNLFGLLTGLASFSLKSNAFVAGALGDSLTSYGGYILENGGQTPSLAFLEAGAAGSYGTVVEPCNYTQKFPDPADYFYQARGFSLAEAYYQSVLNPFQGLMVGEPLVAPFARPGKAEWGSLTNGTVLTGLAALNLNFSAAATNLPLAQADLFVDGTFSQTLTNLPPAAGNTISVTLNGHAIHYTVPANATLAGVSAGLTAALNEQTNLTQVLAFPVGDRIELQSLALADPGSNVTVTTSLAMGSAASLTTCLTAARPAFLDSVATGYQVVTIYKAPVAGDWLQFIFIKTNGTEVSVGVTNASAGSSLSTFAQNLVSQINANPALQAADGAVAADFYGGSIDGWPAVQFFLYARSPGWPASQIQAQLSTGTNLATSATGFNPLADNVSDLRPRNHLYLASGTNWLAIQAACDTTLLPDGYHEFTAVAYEGTSVATQTRVVRTVQVQNSSLAATLTTLPVGTNVTLGQPWQFIVAANATNITRIELFSTGGSVAVATNQAVVTFVVSPKDLGLGLHPFYALVTDSSGHRYQTQTVWYRVIPTIPLTLSGTPPVLAWPATAGRQYYLQSTTNLALPFQTQSIITATNSVIQYPVSFSGPLNFYRVQLAP